jgi:demethylspheroidene O-methyltransferase
VGLRETWLNARNRLITRPSFRDWAQKVPVFQRFANHSAERLFSLCAGFIHSQVLAACVRGGLFQALESGSRSLQELARESGLPRARLERLLEAAAALDLVERLPGERYALGELGAAMCGNAGVEALIRHHDALYDDLAEPLELIRNADFEGRLRRYWAYAASGDDELGEEAVDGYSNVMAASQSFVATQAMQAIDFGTARRVLDVGGGAGAFAIAIARRWPELHVTVADLPPVAAIAEQRIEAAGLSDRVAVVPVDAFVEPLPTGHDLLTFVRILHDHEDAAVTRLLAAAAAALEPGARIAVIEPMADDTRAGRLIDAYFSIYLLAMGQGRPRRFRTLARFLETAGFDAPERVKTRMPIVTSAMVATRSEKSVN